MYANTDSYITPAPWVNGTNSTGTATNVPFYLQGTQTGGILQGTQSDPSTGYVPGQGTAPFSNPAYVPGQGSAPNFGAMSEQQIYQWLHQMQQTGGVYNTNPQGVSSGVGGTGGGVSYYNPDNLYAGDPTAPATNQTIDVSGMTSQNGLPPLSSGTTSSGTSGGGGGGGGGSGGTRPTTSSGGSGTVLTANPDGSGTSTNTNANGMGLFGTPQYTPTGGGDSSPHINGANLAFPNGVVSSYQQGQPGMNQAQGGALQMNSYNPQAVMNQYMQTPGQQLLGQGAGNYFMQSPGYQYAVNQALGQVNANSAARGLLESGRGQRNMIDRAQGMASQEYNNWWNQQNGLFNNYQDRLAGLAGGDTGANNAMAVGAGQSANTMTTGQNLGSLFGNQGNAGFSGILNTGAAQAGAINNAASSQAQINSINQATQLGMATGTGQGR
jgi:hypothetical protein